MSEPTKPPKPKRDRSREQLGKTHRPSLGSFKEHASRALSKAQTPEDLVDRVKYLSDDQLREAVRFVQAERCKIDLFYLATEVLGYKDLEDVHRPLCEVIQSINPIVLAQAKHGSDPDSLARARQDSLSALEAIQIPPEYESFFQRSRNLNARLFLLHRGSFKTTLVSIAHTIQLMLLWPGIRILISSHKKEGGSQEILGAIKRHFIGNPTFRAIFPEYCPKPNATGVIDWGTSEKVTLPNRPQSCIYPEATIEIAGATTDVTGRHYNYIKADDLVTRESVTNEIMLDKTEQYNSLLKFLFDQPEYGIIDYSGTCYHFADLYAGLRDQKDMTKVIMPIVDAYGRPSMKRRFSGEGIDRIKNDPAMSSYVFSCQYMLNPVPEDEQTFRPEWWKRPGFYYDELPDTLRCYVFVDPAAKQRKESDYTALITIGFDPFGDMYLVDIIRDKLDESGRAKLVLETCQKRGTNRVYYESIGFQSTDHYIIKKLAREAGYHLSVTEIKASKISKEDRIRSLQPIYERGDIHWPRKYIYRSKFHKRDIDMVQVLQRELWLFPMCEHDDLADAHSFCTTVNMQRPSRAEEAAEPDFLDKLIEKLVLNKNAPQRRPKGNEIPYRDAPW